MVRLAVIVVALSLAAIAGALLVDHGDDAEPARVGALTMIGDSLNVGSEPALHDELRGWTFETDNAIGRRSDEGIAALQQIGHGLRPVVVVSLGTNDTQTDVQGFRDDVRTVLRLAGPNRCVVWATIWRGGANEEFNDVLADEARDNDALRLVQWDDLAATHPAWLAYDGVHPTPEGYAARAGAIARVVRDCLPAAAS